MGKIYIAGSLYMIVLMTVLLSTVLSAILANSQSAAEPSLPIRKPVARWLTVTAILLSAALFVNCYIFLLELFHFLK